MCPRWIKSLPLCQRTDSFRGYQRLEHTGLDEPVFPFLLLLGEKSPPSFHHQLPLQKKEILSFYQWLSGMTIKKNKEQGCAHHNKLWAIPNKYKLALCSQKKAPLGVQWHLLPGNDAWDCSHADPNKLGIMICIAATHPAQSRGKIYYESTQLLFFLTLLGVTMGHHQLLLFKIWTWALIFVSVESNNRAEVATSFSSPVHWFPFFMRT